MFSTKFLQQLMISTKCFTQYHNLFGRYMKYPHSNNCEKFHENPMALTGCPRRISNHLPPPMGTFTPFRFLFR